MVRIQRHMRVKGESKEQAVNWMAKPVTEIDTKEEQSVQRQVNELNLNWIRKQRIIMSKTTVEIKWNQRKIIQRKTRKQEKETEQTGQIENKQHYGTQYHQ